MPRLNGAVTPPGFAQIKRRRADDFYSTVITGAGPGPKTNGLPTFSVMANESGQFHFPTASRSAS